MKDHNAKLKALLDRLHTPTDFVEGDLVRWKNGLKNRRKPAYGDAVLATEVLFEPVFDPENGAGSPYFQEPLTLKIGWIDEDGDLIEYHADSRRFERVPDDEA